MLNSRGEKTKVRKQKKPEIERNRILHREIHHCQTYLKRLGRSGKTCIPSLKRQIIERYRIVSDSKKI